MYKLITYIPEPALDTVKTALFDAGAGNFGNYDHCSWQTLGVGQFRPLTGATPAIGQVGKIETINEWRVEVIVSKEKLAAVVQVYKATHPYEIPAYDIYELVYVDDFN